MVIDVVTYNGERDMWDIRYNILKDYVDEFIVVEFDKTFSGKDKPWYFMEVREGEEYKYKNKNVVYCQCTEPYYEKYYEEARKSPNTQYGKGADHWIREWAQKEVIKDCLADLNKTPEFNIEDDDIVFIGDADEIWNPEMFLPKWKIPTDKKTLTKLKLKVYTYWLNNRSNEEFWGIMSGFYKDIKGECLNHLRTNAIKTLDEWGWHFTSMGGPEALKKKLQDSYTKESYATKEVIDNLEQNIKNNKDFLGRDFTYRIDESEWPEYLKKNKKKYRKLCYPSLSSHKGVASIQKELEPNFYK